jgi:integrase
LPLARIDPLAVREWVATMNTTLSPSRTRQALFLLSSMLKAAMPEYLARNPCAGVEPPRIVKRDMLFLSAKEVDDLAAATREPYGTLVYLLAYCGLRWGEAVALRRRRCHLLRNRLEIVESLAEVERKLIFGTPKTHQERNVAVPAFLREMLAAHIAELPSNDANALVFTNPHGGPLRNSWFWRLVWEPAVASAGLPDGLRIHDLRHTCAALLIAQGAHPKMIQTQLGHSTITTTLDRYGHLFPDDMDRLATQMDAMYRDGRESPAASPRPGDENVVVAMKVSDHQNTL